MFVYMYIYTFTYDMSRIGVFGMCRISLNDSVTLSEEDARIRERPLAQGFYWIFGGDGCGRNCHRGKQKDRLMGCLLEVISVASIFMYFYGQVMWKHPGRSCEEGECSQFATICTRWKYLT